MNIFPTCSLNMSGIYSIALNVPKIIWVNFKLWVPCVGRVWWWRTPHNPTPRFASNGEIWFYWIFCWWPYMRKTSSSPARQMWWLFWSAPHEGNQLVWRATSIPAKQLKASNVASHFTYGNLVEGPLVLVLRLTTKKDFVDVVYTPFLDLPCVDPTWFFLNLVLPFHLRSGDSASTPRRRL